MEINWIKFEPGEFLPPERRYVLVQLNERPKSGLPPAVAVGYLRIWSTGPWFVVPGQGGGPFEVTHYADCLGDDFKAPLWDGAQWSNTEKRRRRWKEENYRD